MSIWCTKLTAALGSTDQTESISDTYLVLGAYIKDYLEGCELSYLWPIPADVGHRALFHVQRCGVGGIRLNQACLRCWALKKDFADLLGALDAHAAVLEGRQLNDKYLHFKPRTASEMRKVSAKLSDTDDFSLAQYGVLQTLVDPHAVEKGEHELLDLFWIHPEHVSAAIALFLGKCEIWIASMHCDKHSRHHRMLSTSGFDQTSTNP